MNDATFAPKELIRFKTRAYSLREYGIGMHRKKHRVSAHSPCRSVGLVEIHAKTRVGDPILQLLLVPHAMSYI